MRLVEVLLQEVGIPDVTYPDSSGSCCNNAVTMQVIYWQWLYVILEMLHLLSPISRSHATVVHITSGIIFVDLYD